MFATSAYATITGQETGIFENRFKTKRKYGFQRENAELREEVENGGNIKSPWNRKKRRTAFIISCVEMLTTAMNINCSSLEKQTKTQRSSIASVSTTRTVTSGSM